MSVSAHPDFLQRFEAAKPALRAFIASVVQDAGAREDILQSTALTLWEQYDRYDAGRSFGAWARGVAAHKILHDRRRAARFPVILEPEAIEAMKLAFDRRESSGITETDRTHALRQCLAKLPQESRRLLTFRYEDQLACQDIAHRLRHSVEAVYQQLSRLRFQLASCIRRRLQS
jgi:RNA polymerase sigma-70 factor (ECF subfamily)